MDETGDVKENRDYDPWGVPMDQRQYLQGGQALEQFSGQELDDQTGWYHFGQRDLMAVNGRWPSPDRFADKYPSHSPYSYALNDPIGFVDVNGDTIWVDTNDEERIHSVYFQGKLINNSNVKLSENQLEDLKNMIISGLVESFSGQLPNGYSLEMNIDLQVAGGMDEIQDSDHVIAITNLDKQSEIAGKFVPGMVNEIGGKVIYLNKRNFEGLRSIYSNPVRNALHEVGHTMGLGHATGITNMFNLMRAGGVGRNISDKQRDNIIKGRNSFNRGSNRLGPILLPPPTR